MNLCLIKGACFKAILRYFHLYESVLPFGKGTTANLYSHLEYNAKVISAETIARVLDSKKEDSSDESEKKSATPKSMDTKSASDKTTNKTSPKKRGRKKKNDIPADTSQTVAV